MPPTTMGPNWLQFTTGSGMSAVMNAMFQVRLSGYRAAFPESLPKMQVAAIPLSIYVFLCPNSDLRFGY